MTSANLDARDAEPPKPPTAAIPSAPESLSTPAPDPNRWPAFVVMTVAVFMDLLDGSVVNVALPTMQRDVGLSYASVQWVTAGYLLAFALILITGGRLGDILGRRKMFLVGVAGFTVASLLCGVAANPALLVGSRLLQGTMAGLMVPQVLSIIHVTFPHEEKGKVFAVHGGVGGIAATIAPLVGGVIVAANIFGLDWRPIFLVNVPVGVLGLVLGARYIPESRSTHAAKLDVPGVALSAAGMVLLLLPLTFGRDLGWPAWSYASLALSVIVLIGFVAYQRAKLHRGGAPLVALNLFRSRSFSAALGLTLAVYVFTGMFMLSIYLYAQIGLGWSPLRNGLTMLAFALGAFVTATASLIALVPKFGRTVLQVGALVIGLGLVLFLLINGGLGYRVSSWSIAPALFVIGLGFGATATPISMFGLSQVSAADAGSASGLINTKMQLGFALGIAVASLSFFAPLAPAARHAVDTVTPTIQRELSATGIPAHEIDGVTAAFRVCATDWLSESSPTVAPPDCTPEPEVARNPSASATWVRLITQVRSQTFSDAFQVTLYTGLILMLLAFLAAAQLPRRISAPGRE